jgi:sortase A
MSEMSEELTASNGKVSRWDRPKPPHDWRWVVGGIGRTLITLGLMMFAFVAYQLWGTGIQTAQAQRTLSREFEEQVGKAPDVTTTVVATTTTTEPPTTEPTNSTVPAAVSTTTTTLAPVVPVAQPLPADGEALARLEIPRMGLNRIVVEGATADDLKKGPGHFAETPLPGQLGNAAIAGHRTTHLHPFLDIDKLQPGDEIIATTLNGRYVYHVTATEVVNPDDYAAVIPTTDPTKATLTLVSCTPKYSASNRIVVHSELVPEQSDPLTQAAAPVSAADPAETLPAETLPDEGSETVIDTVPPSTTTTPAPVTTAITGAVDTTPVETVPQPVVTATPAPDAFSDGWFSDTGAIPQALMWGLGLAAIAFGIYWVSRKARSYWIGALAGFAPFLVVLYFFYENVNRLLPPNL